MSPVTVLAPSLEKEIEPGVADFYRQTLRALNGAGIRFLVGGAFAQACYTGIRRSTKDLDLFICRDDCERIAQLMAPLGCRTETTFPHWLAKVYQGPEQGPEFIDLIFNSGNGLMPVNDRWFRDNCTAEILGVPVRVANIEDCLLSKAFIMERERYDGGDIAHLLQVNAQRLDWHSLLERFGGHWRVLLAHLALFGYIYPGERDHVPTWVMLELADRLARETQAPGGPDAHVCAGTLLSREQYLHDVERLGYVDGRLTPVSTMTAEDVAVWTGAIAARQQHAGAKKPDEPGG